MHIDLKALREQARLSQEQLAALCGKDQGWVSRLERKERPKIDDVGLYVHALGLNLVTIATSREQAELLVKIAGLPQRDVVALSDLASVWIAVSPGTRARLLDLLKELHAEKH